MPVDKPVLLTARPRFQSAPALEQVERHFFSTGAVKPVSAAGAIEIHGLADIRAEAAFIACRIQRLVRLQNLRYRDIAVIVPDMNLYAHYLASAFEPYRIPYFLDRPQNLQTHPLIELLIAALKAEQSGFEPVSVQMLLKTDWNGLNPLEADILDNYCRAFGISPDDWFSAAPWDFADIEEPIFKSAKIDALRQKFIAPFAAFSKTLQQQLAAEQAVQAIWQLLNTLNIPEKLAAESQKDPDDSQCAHRRVWKKLQEVFEELIEVFGQQTFTPSEITAILLDVLSTLTLKLIPAAADQVLIGSIERSRHPEIKVAFLTGAAYKLFPVPLAADVLLTEQDAQLAARENLALTTPLEQMITARRYLSYIALTRASHQLVITFPTSDEKDTPAAPWPGLERLCVLCPDLTIQYGNPPQMSEPQNLSAAALDQWFCSVLGPESASDKNTKTLAQNLLSCCKAAKDSSLSKLCGDVEYALGWRNEAVLDKAVVSRLVNWPMKTSASRLATFAACPFQYFARHTLGLKKRDLMRLLPVDVGDFYHRILNQLFLDLYRKDQDWTSADADTLAANCGRIANQILHQDRHLAAFVRTSAHNRFVIHQAVANLKVFLPTLAAAGRAGCFRQKAAEMEFGEQNPPLAIEMDKQHRIHLRGRIDRLDCADIDGRWTAIVFDYKSGSWTKRMDWKKFYNGLDIQLAVYLLALGHQTIENRPVENVAGAFYLPLEQSLKTDLKNLDEDINPAVKARGVFNGQYAFDLENVPAGKSSRFYGFSVDSKENLPYSRYGTSDAVKPQEFQKLLQFAQAKIRQLSQQIASGDIRVYPYRLGTESPCPHCDYRPVCKFDWQLNDYNLLPSKNKLEVLQEIGGGHGQ